MPLSLMKINLHKLKFFIVLSLLFVFYGNVNAQCSITGTVYASSRTCSSFSTCPIIYIGDGLISTSLVLNSNLDLTTCSLGPIQIIVNPNANIDFSDQNYDLRLPAGSSISFVGSGTLIAPGSCSASDRIVIGGVVIANCLGSGQPLSFPEVVAQGGYNLVNISPTSASACGSGNFSFTATAVPSDTATAVRWYSVPTGGVPLQTTAGSSSTYSTPTISTTTTYYAEATIGAFVTPRRAVVATINPLPTTLTIGTITQPTCTLATGSVVLSGLPATWTLTRSGTSSATTSGTGTSTTISGLAVGTYTYTVSNGTCTSVASGNIVIPSLATNTWNGSAWSTGSAPTIDQNIVFAGSYPPTPYPNVDITACSCQVTSGTININVGRTLTITNGLTVSGGSMFFKNNSSLVQINNVANSGNITYERSIAPSILETDYTYWSSPVAGFTVGGVSPTTSYFYSYNSSIDNWQAEPSATVMTAGKGYIIRGPAPFSGSGPPPPPAVSPFIGVPNNGNYSITGVIADRSYLIGNPYPSAIDADKFLNANSGVLNGTLYFWTHNTEIGTGTSNLGTGALAYTSNDYAVYNATGGVAATQVDINPLTGIAYPGQAASGGSIPTGKIGAGQGFFGSSKASLSTTTINYTNAMRLDNLGNILNNTQFFRTSNAKTKSTIEKNRVWLNLTNTQGAFKQMLVGYITGATNEYDNAFDGESFDGNEFVDFYSVNQDKNLVIQGRALPFDGNDQVELGFRTTINGAFTIKIDQVDGLFTNQNVFIEDKLTNTVFDLKSGNYTFNTVAGTFNDRFVLRYTNRTLGTNEYDSLENQVLVSNKNKQIKINSFKETIDKVAIYDILGRQVYQKVNVNSNELSISSLVLSHQTLIVKTSLSNGETVTDKIVY